MIDYQLLAKQENPFEDLSEVDAEKMKVYLNLFAIPRMNDDEIFQRYGFISQISSLGGSLQLASVVALELNQQSVTATPAPKSFTPNTPHPPKEDEINTHDSVMQDVSCKSDTIDTNVDDNTFSSQCNRQYAVSFHEAIKRCITNLNPNGRSSRSEFWKVVLAIFLGVLGLIVFSVCVCVFALIATPNSCTKATIDAITTTGSELIFTPVYTLISLPLFALTARRLHDIGRSISWLIVASLAEGEFAIIREISGISPLWTVCAGAITIGLYIVLFCMMLTKSTPQANKYGPVPNVR